MVIFLAGSALAGTSQDMTQLIIYRREIPLRKSTTAQPAEAISSSSEQQSNQVIDQVVN